MATENLTIGQQKGPTERFDKPPTTKEDQLKLVQNSLDYAREFKRNLERHWREVILFLTNEQWIKYHQTTGRFTRHNLENWVPTPQTNYLVKHYDRAMDILTAPDWRPSGRPASKSQKDIDAARRSSKILEHLRRELDNDEAQNDAASWLLVTGNAFINAEWDPRANKHVKRPKMILNESPLIVPKAVCPTCDEELAPSFDRQLCPTCGRGVMELEDRPAIMPDGERLVKRSEEQAVDEDGNPLFDEFHLGDVAEDVSNPFNMFPQPRDKWKNVMYVTEEIPFDLDELADIFGSKAKDIAAEDIELEAASGFLLGNAKSPYYEQGKRQENMVRVAYYRHVPTPKFPKGQYIIEANGTLLHAGDIDTLDGKLPYEHIKWRHIPGEMWGSGPFQDILPLQKRINSIDSSIILNRKTMANPQWKIPQGSGVTFIDGRPGLLINYNPHNTGGAQPTKEPGMGLPNDTKEEREQARSDMEDIFGTQEVLAGQAPTGVEAGVALNLLAEQAFRRFGPVIKNWRRAFRKHERRKLVLVKENYDEVREIEVSGDNEELEKFHFSGADVGNTTDVVIEFDRGAAFSKAAQDQRVIAAADKGWLGDPRSPDVAGKLLEKLDIDGFDSSYNLDAKKARRVLNMLQEGEDPPPFLPQIDNVAIQLQIFKDFILTSEFEELSQEIQKSIIERAQQFLQVQQQMQQAAQQAAQAAKGSTENVSDSVVEAQPGQEAPTAELTPQQ